MSTGVSSAIPMDAINSGSAPASPKNRVKFLCSHGGKILPRPSDGHLKYVGGETRVISVPRDIPFNELMKKLTYLIDGEMILKYQVVSEDLDALVSVKSDDDVRHMCDEIDRYENAGTPRLRAFLFPANPTMLENQISAMDHYALEQRYIDAINGIIRSTPNSMKQHPAINTLQQGSLVSSGCSSPRSPDSCTTETINTEITHQSSRTGMHRVRSSPTLCNLNGPQQNSHHVNQLPPQHAPHHSGYLTHKQPHKSVVPERLTSVRSVGRAEGVRYQVDPAPHYYYVVRQNRGPGCIHYDECGRFSDRRMVDRVGNLAMSPVPSSPRFGHGG